MFSKWLTGNEENRIRGGYIWNMMGTTAMAAQSVILMMVLNRVLGLADAGVFTIAYTTANLVLIIGKYGMHNFHVSDTQPVFSFGDYKTSRWITVALMLLASAAYALFATLKNGDAAEKGLVIFFTCAFKAVDAIEDVYCSLYQQQGRLDVAGKTMTVRVGVTLIFFIACIILIKDLLISIVASTLFTFALFLLLNRVCKRVCPQNVAEKPTGQVKLLLGSCFFLFFTEFLCYYITNAPKYSIDSLLSDEMQACYGFISMPVFVIGLLGNYLFNPLIKPMSEKWRDGDFSWFLRRFVRQIFIVMGITLVCLGGAYFLGIPVLSLVYGTDLDGYRAELLVLIASGGLLALANQLINIVTIIRRQKLLIAGYSICAVLALALSSPVVSRYSLMGAAILELVLMLVLCVTFITLLFIEIKRAAKAEKRSSAE